MRVIICEIAWHKKEPVSSLGVQHGTARRIHRLKSAGVNITIRIWKVEKRPDGIVEFFVCSWSSYQSCQGHAFFSKCGNFSIGGEGAVSLLWEVNENQKPKQIAFQDEDKAQLNKGNWTVVNPGGPLSRCVYFLGYRREFDGLCRCRERGHPMGCQ